MNLHFKYYFQNTIETYSGRLAATMTLK
uniref:Uncharacterized protein n=1 Tax=Arundo donax TaxID=35708 RepID=A0A0A9ACC8_ARUDO